jgi:hypothetical protein
VPQLYSQKTSILEVFRAEEMSTERIYPEDVEFKASVALETYRIPDLYHYHFKHGKLYSPITNKPVETSIAVRSPIEEAEMKAFKEIERWFTDSEEGVVLWISPSSSRDVSTKIIVSDIAYDLNLIKCLRNRAICFDWQEEVSLTFARRMGTIDNLSIEELRATPIFLKKDVSERLMDILGEYTPQQVEYIKRGKDIEIKEELKARLASGSPEPTGPYRPSCNRTKLSAFNTMFEDSLGILESSFDCPKCHRSIPSGQGITTCPHCGAKKEDYQSGCD